MSNNINIINFWTDPSHRENSRRIPKTPLFPIVQLWTGKKSEILLKENEVQSRVKIIPTISKADPRK